MTDRANRTKPVAWMMAFAFLALAVVLVPGMVPVGVSRKSPDGIPLAIHNQGGGTREEDCLFDHVITGHYRVPRRPEADGTSAPR